MGAPEANKILEQAGLLPDDKNRPGKPLRELLRDGKFPYAYKVGVNWVIPISNEAQESSNKVAGIIVAAISILIIFFSVSNNCSSSGDNSNKYEDKKSLGIWADDFNKGILWQIQKNDNGLYILQMSKVNSSKWIYNHKLKRIKKNGQIVYDDIEEGYDEYYQIDNSGNLSVFDNWGYIATYKKAK